MRPKFTTPVENVTAASSAIASAIAGETPNVEDESVITLYLVTVESVAIVNVSPNATLVDAVNVTDVSPPVNAPSRVVAPEMAS